MAVKFSNNGKTTLSASLNNSATSCTVADASVFPSITANDHFYITLEDASLNKEIVKVTAVSSNTLTIVRAQDSSSARAFASGDKAEVRLTVAGLNDLVDISEVTTSAPSSSDASAKPAGYVWYVVS